MTDDDKRTTDQKHASDSRSISKEMIVHGARFASIFDGYFSSPDIARPLVEAVRRAADASRPRVLADLGGGTGFVLSELLRGGLQGVRLVNVEASTKQLAACSDGHIVHMPVSIDRVTRQELLPGDANEKLLLISRSVLHYFGRFGLDPLLRHIRGQLRTGEFFVHQSGAFERQRDADQINHLYARMDTGKWFFTADELKLRLGDSGFIVREVLPAPCLEMSSADLGERYGLSPEKMASIGQEIEQIFGKHEIFARDGGEFKALLQSSIFSCEAF